MSTALLLYTKKGKKKEKRELLFFLVLRYTQRSCKTQLSSETLSISVRNSFVPTARTSDTQNKFICPRLLTNNTRSTVGRSIPKEDGGIRLPPSDRGQRLFSPL